MHIYDSVTQKIIEQLESGTRPWSKPWNSGNASGLPIRSCGTPYQGINVLLLWLDSMENGFKSDTFMTYKQASDLGGQVRKGSKSAHIVYSAPVKKTDKQTGEESCYHLMKGYSVFNVDQIDGLPERFYPVPVAGLPVFDRLNNADQFVTNTGAMVQHGGNSAYFIPSADRIQMPDPITFLDSEYYYSTLLHELTHWTGIESRCNRQFGKRFGDDSYAAEELVAEMGAAFLCAMLGINDHVREDHAGYLNHWLKVLKTDSKAIFTAASAAQSACNYLQGLQVSATMPDSLAA